MACRHDQFFSDLKLSLGLNVVSIYQPYAYVWGTYCDILLLYAVYTEYNTTLPCSVAEPEQLIVRRVCTFCCERIPLSCRFHIY